MANVDPLGLYSWNEFMEDWATAADVRSAQAYWEDHGSAGSAVAGLIALSVLETVQESAETLGNQCKTTDQKIWAGAKIIGVGLSWYGAGTTQITGKIVGQVRTSRLIGLRNKFGEHFYTDPNGYFFAIDQTFHRLHLGPWRMWFTK